MVPNNQRIVSVVPSQTELLFDLGLQDEVIGITKFCVHPNEWFREKKRVGGTKNLNLPLIESLNPTLIIANKEENEKEQIEYLQSKYKVYVSDIKTYEDALQMIEDIGILVNKQVEAIRLIDLIREARSHVANPKTIVSAIYLIWKKPYMAAGHDTFIHDMMKTIGIQNCVSNSRYPMLSTQEIQALNPDLILLSSEPYPFKDADILELQAILPHAKIKLVDGEMFSWYGSRLKYAFEYFNGLKLSS